jgi:RNA polymerase sigma factor (sigma-70 family)
VTHGGSPGRNDHDRIEFEEFFKRHYRDVRRYVHSCWPQSDSGSIANQAFERAWRKRDSIHGDRIRWVMVTAKRLAIDACRKQRELPLEPTEMNARMTSAAIANDAARTRIRQAVEALPPRFQKALTMHTWGYSNEDIARAMGCKVSSVSVYLAEARNLVAKQIGGRPQGGERRARAAPSEGRSPRNHHDDEED